MKIWKARAIYHQQNWMEKGEVAVDPDGRIRGIGRDLSTRFSEAEVEEVQGWLIPGLVNAHSHAFQYAMSGRAEKIDPIKLEDDFWTWREQMYRLAGSLSSEQIQTVAAWLYLRMMEHGYSHVVEFHYLHHAPDGKKYEPLDLVSRSLIAAAQEVGMGLTLVPVYYRRGGFDQDSSPEQRRFIWKSVEEFSCLIDGLQQEFSKDVVISAGLHSMRAADPEEIKELVSRHQEGPFHVHISEQLAEVEQCQKALGARPLEWWQKNIGLSEQMNFVHATHLSDEELMGLAHSDSRIVVCPSTEGNLGDGIFPLVDYLQRGGTHLAIGSDSHVGLDPFEELRWWDYTHRYRLKKRNVLSSPQHLHGGQRLFDLILQGGQRSAGLASDSWSEGQMFRALLIDDQDPIFTGHLPEDRLSILIYGSSARAIRDHLVGKEKRVRQGLHIARELIAIRYRSQLSLDPGQGSR